MVSRKEEELEISAFKVGESYTRAEIAELGAVQPLQSSREWTGIVEFKNCVVLFSTLQKEDLPPEHNYADVFSDFSFLWESQNRNTQRTPVILRIISLDAPVLLFCRLTAKASGVTQPFVYVGTLTAEDYESERPVQMRFNVDQYIKNAPAYLQQLYDWRPGDERILKPIEAPERKPRIRKGQGRQSDPKKRKAVELRAMEVAMQHYSDLGYAITDTSANNPYDLECTKEKELIRVEVKGLAGALGSVEVTIGEVLSARSTDFRTDLFVVYSISLKEKGKSDFVGEGGQTHVETRWEPSDEDLEAVRFRYVPS